MACSGRSSASRPSPPNAGATAIAPGKGPPASGTLSVTFFDIGQGDAALVTSPTQKRVLIDAGPPEGTAALLGALQAMAVQRLDLVILSHPHLDHLGGLKQLLDRIPVTMYMDAGYDSESPPYTSLLKSLAAHNVPVKQAKLGRTIDVGGGVELRLLSPPEPWLVRTRSDVNANSVVVRLTFGARSVLFTGDAEPQTERWLLSQYADQPALLMAEVLKVPHHGGTYSSTAGFLAAVHPQWAVISVAAANDYGHPTPEAIGRLERVGARVMRTDQLGHITLRSQNGRAWEVDNKATRQVP